MDQKLWLPEENKEHECQLPSEISETQFPILHYDASYWDHCKRYITFTAMVANNIPKYLYSMSLRSSASVRSEQLRQFYSDAWYIIHPLSQFRMKYDIVLVIVLIASMIVSPLSAAFEYRREVSAITVIHFLVNCFMWFDICMNFMSGYLDARTDEIVMDPIRIKRQYMNTTANFFLDFVFGLPMDLIVRFVFGIETHLVGLFTFGQIFRVRYIRKFLRKIIMCAGYSDAVWKAEHLVLIIVFVIHWNACFIFMMSMISIELDKNTRHLSWIVRKGMYDLQRQTILWSKPLIYNACLKASVELFIGCSHEEPIMVVEEITFTVQVIVNCIAASYLLVSILQIVLAKSITEMKYHKMMTELDEYCEHKRLPEALRSRILMYYRYHFHKRYFYQEVILKALSASLKQEITIHSCQHLVDTSDIFKRLSRTELRSMIACMHQEIYLPKDVIIKSGTMGDCMYFLANGTVAISTPTGKEVCHLEDGAHFGEASLLSSKMVRIANVVALEICDVYRLDRTDYQRIIHMNSQLSDRIKNLATTRRATTKRLEVLAERNIWQTENKRSSSIRWSKIIPK